MLFVKKLDPRATLPTCAHPGEDLAYDLYALEDMEILYPSAVYKVRTGIAVEHTSYRLGMCGYEHFPDGLLICDRSSRAVEGTMKVGGVIDAGFRGEVIVLLKYGASVCPFNLKAGDKIAQMIPVPVLTGAGVMQVQELHEGLRGDNGFGSTGR